MLVDEVVISFAEKAIEQIKQNIKTKGAYNTGKTSQSLKYSWDGKELIIYSTFKYITVLEEGRKPGKLPPAKALEDWVRTKLDKNDYREIRSIAYAIRNKIAEKGTMIYQQGRRSGILSTVINEEYVKENLTDQLMDHLVDYATQEFLIAA